MSWGPVIKLPKPYWKQKNVYKKIVLAVANASPDLADNAKGFINDGEESLYSALGEVMRHATGLRCFRHFQQNCSDKLHKLGTEQKFFIDTVFGTPISEGLLDAYDKSDLRRRTLAAKDETNKEEIKLTGNATPGFWSYVNSHQKMMKKMHDCNSKK